jgi:NADPH:quinone reductase-like Zn-dependent oxidoreductase
MMAVVTTGHGDYDKLEFRQVPVPVPGPGEILLQVLAAGVNNTDINTRLGWYQDGGWNTATPFPLIQGADCCGRVVAGAAGGDHPAVGARVLVRSSMRTSGYATLDNVWLGSDFNGAFAQFVKVPAGEAFAVSSDWSDAELGSIPCAYGTAENMLHRARVAQGEHVLVAGASGGVGSAVVQLAKRRGATVTAIAGATKLDQVRALGADQVIDRELDLVAALGAACVDVTVDNVAGPSFSAMLKVLRRGGRYVSSGAIAGPLVTLDMRTLYLNDLTLIGSTAWDEPVFPNLISYIEREEIRPLVAGTFPLERIADAQREFLEKKHVGKLVLIPPPVA